MKQILARLVAIAIALNASAFAGGWFVISLGQPGAHSDARAHDAAFVVRVYGCSAASAKVTAIAEGLVNGERRSIPLEPVRLAGGRDTVLLREDGRVVQEWPGFDVAIPRNWAPEGNWVIRVLADGGWRTQSALVVLNATGIDRAKTHIGDTIQPSAIDAALRALDKDTARPELAARQ